MTFSVGPFRIALSLLAALALCGCLRSAPSQSDEEKESHFLLGRSRVSAMDYQGAIEAFGRALEVNPRSAAAHFELACLFEKREADPAAAIYHYQQYLRLRPKAENTDTVNQHIQALKQELARNVSLGPVAERQQREFERLAEENRRLNEEVEKWRSHAIRLQALTNQTVTALAAPPGAKPATAALAPTDSPRPTALARNGSLPTATRATPRLHRVKAGETATMIARQYRVRVDALLAANPRIQPRRLQVGQMLNVPAANP